MPCSLSGKHASGENNLVSGTPDKFTARLNAQGHAAANRNGSGPEPQPQCESWESVMRVSFQG
eukprot:1084168-Pleurochrysis_carterae.AAC.1